MTRIKPKLGTIASRTKGKTLTPLETTQFALEQAIKRIAALEAQGDGLARLDKKKDIRINHLALKLRQLEERAYRGDSE